jgi:hypothetical protein
MATKTTTGGKKRASAAKKPSARKKSTAVAKAKKVRKVDIYPNRMTVAVSALAGTVLLLVTIIAALGSRG